MPTTYPKSSPTEMLGLLVLLKDHHGEDDLARLADDLDLEIDEILPSSDWAEVLGLVRVDDGRMTFTPTGRALVDASIRERKSLLREQLLRSTLFATLARSLETAPGGRMDREAFSRLIALTAAPADDAEQNIVNWGRYAEVFRYDPDGEIFTLIRHRPRAPAPPSARSPPSGPSAPTVRAGGTGTTAATDPERVLRAAHVAT